MKLWLARHPTPQVPPGICYGRADVPADPAAAWQSAQALHAQLPRALTWRSSPARRAQALLTALRTWRPEVAQAELDARLAEVDFGCWELQPWDELPRAELDAWAADFGDYVLGAGSGENVRALLRRVRSALRDALLAARHGGQDAAWVTHAGVIRAVLLTARAGWHALPQRASDWPAVPLPFGQALCVPLDTLAATAPYQDFP
jgi:alpha-ribazole phosphatase